MIEFLQIKKKHPSSYLNQSIRLWSELNILKIKAEKLKKIKQKQNNFIQKLWIKYKHRDPIYKVSKSQHK